MPQFVYYFLLYKQNYIYKNLRSGAAQSHVYAKDIAQIDYFELPIDVQKRIIYKLDSAFAEIDKRINNIQIKKDDLLLLRDSILKEKFKKSSDNEQKYFSEICTLKRGYDLPKSKREKGRFPLLSANGITDYIDSFKILGPGVVTGRSGTIGKVHFVENDFHPLNTALYVKDYKGHFEKYIYYFLKSFNLKRFSSGAGVPTLNRNVLSNEIAFINSDRSVQIKISKELDSVELEIHRLFSIMKKKKELHQLLKSTILSKEFHFEFK